MAGRYQFSKIRICRDESNASGDERDMVRERQGAWLRQRPPSTTSLRYVMGAGRPADQSSCHRRAESPALVPTGTTSS